MTRRRIVLATTFAVVACFLCPAAYCQGGFGEADANSDEKIDAAEMKTYVSGKMEGFERFNELFKKLDTDNDDSISEDEFEDRMEAIQTIMSSAKPEMDDAADDRDAKKTKQSRKRRPRKQGPSLKVGQEAPTFNLKSLDGKSETDIADFKGKKPVVLIFGSYT